ncbi:MAG: type II toxin-antitoxin system HicB family antitoxin [Acidobacteria bacterium]|nr:type II toxin-antitoxin system HicB family antitoxin [Acidobacteriota bacterium]
MAGKKYRAVYDRDADGRWNVEIPEVAGCYTYGRTIAQARARIREALGLYVENAEDVTIVDDIRLPAPAMRRLERLARARADAERVQLTLSEEQRAAARQLREVGLSFRDSGELLGCTRQRVEQLTREST